MIFLARGDSNQIGEDRLNCIVHNLPERMRVLAFLQTCKLTELAEDVVEAWQRFDKEIGR